MRKTWITLFIASIILQLAAQTTGLRCSDERYQAIATLPTYSGAKYNEVPLRTSLRKHCPVPGDQKQTGSCVGWAVGYGALTIMRAQQAGITDASQITEMAHSAAFIYNQIRLNAEDCTAGAYIEDALALLKSSGDCLEKSFNYNQQDCRTLPEKLHVQEAFRYRIQDYATVFDLNEPPKNKVSKACKVLATKTPIIVGMSITSGFWEIKPGARKWYPREEEQPNGYHAMVLVGYDNVEKEFELLNSFGASWGNNGFIRIRYDDFERLCRYAYVLAPMDAGVMSPTDLVTDFTNTATALSGEFVFRKPAGYLTTGDGDEVPFFEEVATQRKPSEGIYTTQQPWFEVGDVFQLVAREIPRGRYAYVFSQSPDRSVNLHFPRLAAAGKTAGFVLENTAEIVIPNEETVLQLPVPGSDYLCILYSYAPISDVERRLQDLQESALDFPARVAEAFADVLISAQQVRFSEHKMAFTALAKPELMQIAVPLILKVEAR